MLVGPNGAGKSTFYKLHLAAIPLPFINADLLGQTLLQAGAPTGEATADWRLSPRRNVVGAPDEEIPVEVLAVKKLQKKTAKATRSQVTAPSRRAPAKPQGLPKINVSNVGPLYERIVTILEDARARVVRVVNSEMVLAYWSIGREIVE